MPFLRASTDISVFSIASPDRVTSQKLRQHAFRPIDDLKTETLAAGWTSIEDMANARRRLDKHRGYGRYRFPGFA